MSARIVRVDAYNVAVQELRDVETITTEGGKRGGKRTKTGETRSEWVDAGYYGHRLEWAAESALFQSLKVDSPITKETIKQAVAEIVKETKACLGRK